MFYFAWVRRVGVVALWGCLLLAGCGGDDSDEKSAGETEGTGGSGTTDGTGGSSDGTGGSAVSPCDGPLIDLADLEGTVGAATPIAADESWGFVRGLEGVGEDLYVLAGNALYVIEGDSTDRTLISDQVPDLSVSYLAGGRGRLRVDATHAYVATAAGISRIALSDGSVEDLYDGSADGVLTYALQISGDVLYFGISNDHIYGLPLAGGEAPTLVTDQIGNKDFWVDGGYVYGPAQHDYISRVPIAGGEVETVSSHAESIQPFVNQTQVHDGKIYWNDSGVFLSCTIGDCSEPASHNAYHSDYFVVIGDRVYGTNGSMGWSSLVSDECQLLVAKETPYEVTMFGVTDNYVFIHGSFEAGVGAGPLLRLPIE